MKAKEETLSGGDSKHSAQRKRKMMLLEIERLVAEVAALDCEEAAKDGPPPCTSGEANEGAPPTRATDEKAQGAKEKDAIFREGDEVIITVRGRYCGMRGVLVRRRGTEFWDIALEREGELVDMMIYKMPSSFELA